MARLSKALTFSNVIACLALFVALGGSVYAAGKISGKQIKKGSLPGNRIKPKTIAANRIKPKALTGSQVKPQSLTAKQINQKTLTGISAASLSSLHYQSTTIAISPTGWPATRATADCPQGTYVVGGGATMNNAEGRIEDNGPSGLYRGWTASGFSWFSGTEMTVTAICVAVEKPSSAAQAIPPQYRPVP
jgi:hypothetical protein